jgi:CubicO group peptidase (beta-lactamase class C family)
MRKLRNWICVGLWAGTLVGQTIPTGGDGCVQVLRDALTGLMARHRLVGGATLAVAQNGQLKAACFAGYADALGTRRMTTTTLMRIADVSKLITAAAIFKLVDQGRLRVDDRVATLLRDLVPGNGFADARWNDITVQHLLQHTGGWDSVATYDPMFRNRQIADLMGERAPATTEVLARYMMGQPMQFAPGSRYVYSNFGFALLGLIIARLGRGYERYVRDEVMAPVGIHGVRTGRSLPEGQTTGMGNTRSAEAEYIAPAGNTTDLPVLCSCWDAFRGGTAAGIWKRWTRMAGGSRQRRNWSGSSSTWTAGDRPRS